MFSRFSELSHFLHKTKHVLFTNSPRFFTKGSKKTNKKIEPKIIKQKKDKYDSNNKETEKSQKETIKYPVGFSVTIIMSGVTIGLGVAAVTKNVQRMKSKPTILQDKLVNEYLIHGEVKEILLFGAISRYFSGVVAEVILHPDDNGVTKTLGLVDSSPRDLHRVILSKESELNIPPSESFFIKGLRLDFSDVYFLMGFLGLSLAISVRLKTINKFQTKNSLISAEHSKFKKGLIKYWERKVKEGNNEKTTTTFPKMTFPFDGIFEEEHIKTDIKFKDVAGLHSAKQEVKEFLDYLKDPIRFQCLGAKLPRGAMLLGPPGCGKTLLIKALSNESDVPFYYRAGSEISDMIGGVGAKRLRKLFETARRTAPSIIFLDEIDALGKKRDVSSNQGSRDQDQTLVQLLVEMDGMDPNAGVIVFAATNRVDILDKALIRPGRFDRHILIDLPVLAERREIFDLYLRKNMKNLESDLQPLKERLSIQTPGMTGADISNLCNEAALTAARLNYTKITDECFDIALERIIAGSAKKNNVLTKGERRIVAYHEAGHALLGWLLKYADPVMKVSIVPRTNAALGFAQLTPSEKYLETSDRLIDRITVLLGGRAAEALIFNSITSGALDDLQKVKKIAFSMVRELGMSEKLGHLSYEISEANERFESFPYSKNTRDLIDAEANSIVTSAYKRAAKVLLENKDKLELIATELLSKEVLKYDDIQKLIGVRPHEIVSS